MNGQRRESHHHRRLGAVVAEQCARNTFLSRALEIRSGRRNRICRSWASPVPAYPASPFVHNPTLAQGTSRAALVCRGQDRAPPAWRETWPCRAVSRQPRTLLDED